MNRRGLLKTLIGALVLDPERALWVPGAKLISIPRPYVSKYRALWPGDVVESEGMLQTVTSVLRKHRGGYLLAYDDTFRGLQALPFECTTRDVLEMRDGTWDVLNARIKP